MRSTYPKPVLFLWKRDGDVFGGVRFRASHIRRAASATCMGQTHSRMSWQTPQFQPCQHGAAVEHHPAELVSALAAAFADGIRRFVAFAAEHPELNQIMVHEGTTATDRLKWLTETHLPGHRAVSGLSPRSRHQTVRGDPVEVVLYLLARADTTYVKTHGS